jgi:hypothetical protein
MEAQTKAQLMNQLFAEIEQGWRRRRDRTLVYRFAETHPELRDELYEFFEDLVVGDMGRVSSETADAEESIAKWIRSSGVDLAIAAAKHERPRTTTTEANPVLAAVPPDTAPARVPSTESERVRAGDDTWIAFLRRRVRQSLPKVASALPNVTVEYLVLVSRHPDSVPSGVCKALAQFVENQWQVPADESLQCLSNQRLVIRAASRSRPFGKEPSSFDELLERSALTSEQKTFWLQYAASGDGCNS